MSVLSELGFLALRNLSTILDYDSSQQRNWLGLAGKMELSYATVARLREDRSSSPTVALLKEWQEKQGVYQLKCMQVILIRQSLSLPCTIMISFS